MPKQSIPDQFSDDEMEQMKRYGAAQLGSSDFSDQVEKELDKLQANREASAGKMRAAQTGGGDQSLGPSQMDQAQVKQRGAINQQSDTQAAQQAAQAQAQAAPVNAPPAPSGPQGTTTSFPAQKGDVGGGGDVQQPPPASPAPGGPPSDEGEDPSEQWPPH